MIEKLEENFTLTIVEKEADIPADIRDKLQPGELLAIGETLNTNFLPKDWLEKLAEDSQNQRVLWRHKDPENPEHRGQVYGRVLKEIVIPDEKNPDVYKIKSYNRIFVGPDGSVGRAGCLP